LLIRMKNSVLIDFTLTIMRETENNDLCPGPDPERHSR